MGTEVDTEILITLVQERPILWDKTEEEYHLQGLNTFPKGCVAALYDIFDSYM